MVDRPRLIRWLRISASAACLLLCGLLIAFWVRSYWREEVIGGLTIGVVSAQGRLLMLQKDGQLHPPLVKVDDAILEGDNSYILLQLKALNAWSGHLAKSAQSGRGVFGIAGNTKTRVVFIVPYWSLVLLSAALAGIPWLPWSTRFSLRTMLVVTAVVAVVLGIGVWMVR